MAQSFFGLRESDKEYIYEEIYVLVRHCNISHTEAWDMPVAVRKWWIKREERERKEEAKVRRRPTGSDPEDHPTKGKPKRR